MLVNDALTRSTLNSLNETRSSLRATLERLSTGRKVSASSNPAANAIVSQLSANLTSQGAALRNVNDGLSLVQTAEGGLRNSSDQLTRLRELAVQASSDTLSASQRVALNQEGNAILQEINRVANTTQFNGQALLNGAASSGLTIQAGVDGTANDQIQVAIPDSQAAALGITTASDPFTSAASSQAFIAQVDTALKGVSERRANLGATQNRLVSARANLQTGIENTAAARSTIGDADFAEEATNLRRADIFLRSGTSVLQNLSSVNKFALKLLG